MEEYDDPLTLFQDAIANQLTRDRYEKRLDQFLKFLNTLGETLQVRAEYFAVQAS